MTALKFLALALFAIASIGDVSNAATCESPKYTSAGYSTLDGFFHYSTTYIVEFNLQCSNNIKDVPFYAAVNGRTYQVAVSEEVASKYQVSWQLEHPQSGAQTFNVQIYDEDKFADYKKAEQNGQDPSSVAPLFTIQYYHPGVSKKALVSSETAFLVVTIAAFYFATTFKNQFKLS